MQMYLAINQEQLYLYSTKIPGYVKIVCIYTSILFKSLLNFFDKYYKFHNVVARASTYLHIMYPVYLHYSSTATLVILKIGLNVFSWLHSFSFEIICSLLPALLTIN